MTAASEISRDGIPVHLHVGSEQLTSGSGGRHDHISPITGKVTGTIPLAGAEEIDRAVRTAHEAFQTWRRTPPVERRRLLLRLADLWDQHDAELARLTTLETGFNYTPPTGEQSFFTAYTRYYAGWADKYTTDVVATWSEQKQFAYTLAQPYGVVGVIVTWNGPLGSIAMKVPAALAAGNTVVIKPSELTPYGPEYFMSLVREAGFPPGVINILPGTGEAGAALVQHPLVKKVTFTGGSATGEQIVKSCAGSFKPLVLELGGKSANVIFDDADLDISCTHGGLLSVGILAGQGCSFPSRMLVQETIYPEVVARMEATAKSFTVGDPFDPTTVTGPVINQAALDRILGMIERAPSEGARLVTGGSRAQLPGELAGGYYIEPTVFADVDPQSELAQKEVFGPVLAITPFKDEAEAIEIANSTQYGLAAYLRTNDVSRALRVAEQLDAGDIHVNGAGNLMINRPFGGRGLSGQGKEGGKAGYEEFLQFKSVGIGMGEGPIMSYGS
jgi:aldehyde dehydrogenase (NAD+)